MNKKVMTGILSIALIASAAPTTFAGPVVEKINSSEVTQIESQLTNLVSIGNVKFDKEVFAETNVLNPYVYEGTDGLLHIDPAGKEVTSDEAYSIVHNGISIINSSLSSGASIIINNSVVANPNVIVPLEGFSNTYWWGVALTMNKADTAEMAYQLSQISTGFAAEAAVATLISAMFPNPGTFAAAASGAIVSAGTKMVSDSLKERNNVNGVTLNVHWLPLPYYEVTKNSKVPYNLSF